MDPLLFSALTRVTSVSTSDRARLFRDPEWLALLGGGRLSTGPDTKLSKMLANLDWERCRREDEAFLAEGGRILAWPDEAYPELLREIPDPPPALYLRGEPSVFRMPAVAVVGSRLSTVYGQNVARMLSEDLARTGTLVVSGLARGIDKAAHEGALAIPGRTAAVLGTGIDVVYPRENKGLFDRILKHGGAVVTENPPGTPPLPRQFPVRNRIIAGIAWGTVVVEANERSGSLVTARFTAETGREVFAVPHNITSRTGVGPNTLLQKGAKLVQQVGDILEEMPDHLRPLLADASPEESASRTGAPAGEAARLVAALAPDLPKSVDALCGATGLAADRVLVLLLDLKLAGQVVELPGMRYALGSAKRR